MTKGERQYCGAEIVSSTNGSETTGHVHEKKMSVDTDFTPFTKINSKWITHLHVKCKTIKFIEDNIEENLWVWQ